MTTPLICPACNGTGRLAPKSHDASRYGETTQKLLGIIANFCAEFHLENKVKADTLEYTVKQYVGRGIHMSGEVQKCLVWCRDKGCRMINTSRIQNWFMIAVKKRQQQERQMQEAVAAKPELPDVPVIDIEGEQRQKVDRDPRLRAFLQKTATNKAMPDSVHAA